MVQNANLTLLLQQLPYLSKVATAEVVHPSASKMVLAQRAQDSAQKFREQVQKAQESERAKLKPDTEGSGGGASFGLGERREKKQPEPEQEPASNASPWSGNLLNKRI
jgi:hypothetical protein